MILDVLEVSRGGEPDSAAITLVCPDGEYRFVFLDRDQVVARVRELLAVLDEPARELAVRLLGLDLAAFHEERLNSGNAARERAMATTDAGPAPGNQGAHRRPCP
ncbi:hypothetical protein [Yinghuangia seranimata]|uniref:hypothetical protein n=1 Tax=Yinghuangia seranimata TaxID=408067 RepID=UPI00248C6333|nr:hypothetical protein [Yinghuangia seranimata]MDI2127954.1 hypothetical protein [Yinghuangia seranimata]